MGGLRVMNQLLGAAIEVVSADPVTNLATGRLVYNKLTGIVRIYNGSAWADVNSTNPNVYFNKFVGSGAGYYATLTLAMAAASSGDCFLVTDDTVEPATVVVAASDIRITWQPSAQTSMTNGAEAVIVSGNRVTLERPNISQTLSGSITNGVRVSGEDCRIDAAFYQLIGGAFTVTNALRLDATAARTYARFGARISTGLITNLLSDVSGSSSAEVYGG